MCNCVINEVMFHVRKLCKHMICFACVSLFFCSNHQEKKYHIGVLSGLDYFSTITDGFKEKLTEMGYVEGKNVFYDVKLSNVDTNTYKAILSKFIADKVDLIFVFPTEATIMAKKLTSKSGIPVVFANVAVENINLINNIRAPGGNITGVRWPRPADLAIKRLEILHELVPKAVTIWVPYLKNYSIVKEQLSELHRFCKDEKMELIEIPANNSIEIDSVMQSMKRKGILPDAILMIIEPLSITHDGFIVLAKFAEKYSIPFGGAYKSIDGYQSLFGLLPQNIPQGKQAAFLADKILRGEKAGSIPVVSADIYFVLNYKAAVKLGLNVSRGLLGQADEVIR